MKQCRMVNGYRRFEGVYCLHLQGLSIRLRYLYFLDPEDEGRQIVQTSGNHLTKLYGVISQKIHSSGDICASGIVTPVF